MKFSSITTSAMLVALYACSSAPSVPFAGTSTASDKLKADTYNMIAMLTSGKGCSSIDKVVTSVVEQSAGELGKEKSAERWVAHGCGKEFPYAVTYTSDGIGGAFFSVEVL